MTSKIENFGPQPNVPTRRVTSAESGGTAGGARVEGVVASDSVKLTDDARLLQQLEKAVADAPVVDDSRVADVRQALQDGSYRVNSQSVAAKLARMEWELAQ